VRIVNHTLLLIRSVSQFSTKHQFSEVEPSQTHFLRTIEFFSAVARARSKSHNAPDTECVMVVYKISVSEVEPSQTHFLRTIEFFSAVARARSKSHNAPDTECVMVVYKISVSEVEPSQSHFGRHRVFLGSGSCA